MAHELGYFKKFGIKSVISKEASWAVIRDKLTIGENQATHMLIGMPLASTMGLAGSPVKPMVTPWILNRNGQAITLNNKLKAAGVKTPAQIKPLADRARTAGDPLTFAMTFPPGTHAMWIRYWLASGGIHPDKDVNLITIIQVMRPISPLAWLPLGLILFQRSEPAALFAIAICSMWPTLINTMMGVRAIPQDYWNVAKVLRLSRWTTFVKVIVPATLPYMFTGYRLSLGIAWLVIVASEMLTGTPGVGGFLWQEYNSLVYAHILLAIITIGVIGFVLDRLMGLAEARLRAV